MPPNHIELGQQPEDEFAFTDLPADVMNAKQYKRWNKELADHLYRNLPLQLFVCKELGETSKVGESEMDARIGWMQKAREIRDAEKSKLRDKYAKLQNALETKLRAAQQRVEREKADYDHEKWNTALSFGQSILGALLGNKIASRTNVTRSTAAAKKLGKAAQQRSDLQLATDSLDELLAQKYKLEEQCEAEVHELQDRFSVESLTLEPLVIPCRKTDINIDLLCLLWVPFAVDHQSIATPLVKLPDQQAY